MLSGDAKKMVEGIVKSLQGICVVIYMVLLYASPRTQLGGSMFFRHRNIVIFIIGLLVSGAVATQLSAKGHDVDAAASASASPAQADPHEYVKGQCLPREDPHVNDGFWRYPPGHATIDCAIAQNGDVTSCRVTYESVKGSGALVAHQFLCYAHVDPDKIPGGITENARRKFTYRW